MKRAKEEVPSIEHLIQIIHTNWTEQGHRDRDLTPEIAARVKMAAKEAQTQIATFMEGLGMSLSEAMTEARDSLNPKDLMD